MYLAEPIFLPVTDANRATQTLNKLSRHNIRKWALTGGLAIELHYGRLTGRTSLRPLNDIDFIVDSFESLPESLAVDFLFRHIHPFDSPGKTLLQSIDAESTVRVDVFRAYGAEMSRSNELNSLGPIRLVSVEDLVARNARLALDLALGQSVPAVHCLDFLRLAELVDPGRIEPIWSEHRKPLHPETYREARQLLGHLIPAHPELLIMRKYSKHVEQVCSRCRETSAFRLTHPTVVLSLLGYC
jgi:hypothetical protein